MYVIFAVFAVFFKILAMEGFLMPKIIFKGYSIIKHVIIIDRSRMTRYCGFIVTMYIVSFSEI